VLQGCGEGTAVPECLWAFRRRRRRRRRLRVGLKSKEVHVVEES
jgi:hypothetical protein